MKTALRDVEDFHRVCDLPILATPTIPSAERAGLRIELIEEEVNRELLPAMRANDLVSIADAMADSIYVIVGAALEYGIPLDKVWAEVQRANMTKCDIFTGKVKYREDGKVLKPDGWQPPNIAAILGVMP
jgi:predicted HAD superfamily Cof-like phosphohydrolase